MGTLPYLNTVLFSIGETQVRISSLITVVISLILLFAFARLLERWLMNRVLTHTHLDVGARQTTGTLVRYVVIVVGLALIMQNIGLNLAALGVLAGAVGVGIGFGLQNVFSNFISGLIVMVERPVKIGDRIEIGGAEGDVVSIGLRATTLSTSRRAQLIIPNQKLITEIVRNWNAEGGKSSLMLPIKVAPGVDPKHVTGILLDAAKSVPEVVEHPAPEVDIASADASGYSLQMQVWTSGDSEKRSRTLSELYLQVFERLRREEIKVV